MKKQAVITALIMCWAMCLPGSGIRAAESGNTKRPSGSSEIETAAPLDKRIEEVEILWKLERRREALEAIKDLLASGAESPRLWEVAAFIYLDAGQVDKAEALAARLEAAGKKGEMLDHLRGAIYVRQEKWDKAKPVYEHLYESSPEQAELSRLYAKILGATRDYGKSREVYRKILEREPHAREVWWDYRNTVEEGAAVVENVFQYYHRPQAQRDYRFAQSTSFWVNPWLRFGAGLAEDNYRRGDWGGDDAIKRLVMTHTLEGEAYYKRLVSVLMGWKSSYCKNTYESLYWRARVERSRVRSEVAFDWNELSRDPILAVTREGRIHRFRLNNEIGLLSRLQTGHQFRVEWYRLPGRNNPVNGASNLGHDFLNDIYANLVLSQKPYLSMNYHYRDSHWDQKFPGADTVIGYLSGEMAHYGGFYAEHPVGKIMNLVASVTRGYDHKRNVNSLIWYFETRIWAGSFAKASLSYEYDRGDSGTAGRGDTQIMTTKLDVYF
jgi:tetratricopeptide (TPR) repeat protein